MKLTGKEKLFISTDYNWAVEEVKTERDCLKLVAVIAGLKEECGISFRGYEDMDEHGNWTEFGSVEEYKKGIKEVEKIDPDSATIRFEAGDDIITIYVWGIMDNEQGTKITVSGRNENAVKEVSMEIKKAVEKEFG